MWWFIPISERSMSVFPTKTVKSQVQRDDQGVKNGSWFKLKAFIQPWFQVGCVCKQLLENFSAGINSTRAICVPIIEKLFV